MKTTISPNLRRRTLVLAALLLAFAFRLNRLDFQPLWGDEGWSLYFAAMPLWQMVDLTAVDIHPPLYYTLLHFWRPLVGPGPEAARLLSVVAGMLLVATMAAWAARLRRDQRWWWPGLAALVVAINPMAIYYSQEVRMYGLVTLLCALGSLLLGRALRGRTGSWWLYGLVMAAALYTMYYAGFVLLAHGLILVWHSRRDMWRHRLAWGMGLAGGLYLPWVLFAGGKLLSYVADKADIEGYVALGWFAFWGRYLQAFGLGHQLSTGYPPPWLGVFLLLLGLGGLVWLGRQGSEARRQLALLLAVLIIPLSLGWLVNLSNPFTPRFFERTLLVAAPAWWLSLSLGLAGLLQSRRYRLAMPMLSFFFVLWGLSLWQFYTQARYVAEDYRPLLRELAARATDDDVILASYQWQLGFFDAYLPEDAPVRYEVPAWGQIWGTDSTAMERDLQALLSRYRVWFPAHQTQGRIWENQAEALLAREGFPARLQWLSPNTKVSLVGPQQSLQSAPMVLNFADLLQARIALPTEDAFETGRGIIPLAITWQAQRANLPDGQVSLRLVDETGEIWAVRDSRPQAAQRRFSELAAGQTLRDHHGLAVPAGTPPGTYQLQLGLLEPQTLRPLDLLDAAGQPQGTEADLMTVRVLPAQTPLGPAAVSAQQRFNLPFDNQATLVGVTVAADTVEAGLALPVSLFWQANAAHLPPLISFVQVQDEAGRALALTERPPVYPSEGWPGQALVRDQHTLRLPPTLPAGTYRLAAGLLRSDKTRLQTPGGDQAELGSIVVTSRPRSFDPPPPVNPVDARFGSRARLLDYQIVPAVLEAGGTLTLTTIWQAEAEFTRNWTIFAHLIDAEGQIRGQRDQLPGDGKFSTLTWVPGEIITDTRRITLRPDVPPGEVRLRLGFYDARTFERLPLDHGGDSLLLPLALGVTQN